MENITLGQIAAAVGIITVILGGYKLLNDNIKNVITKVVTELLKPLSDSIDSINMRLDKVDRESCKNFLVRCLADVEKGEEMSETETARFWEQYEHYVESGGNTYIMNKVERLKQEGRL